jgi:hypothetical protein
MTNYNLSIRHSLSLLIIRLGDEDILHFHRLHWLFPVSVIHLKIVADRQGASSETSKGGQNKGSSPLFPSLSSVPSSPDGSDVQSARGVGAYSRGFNPPATRTLLTMRFPSRAQGYKPVVCFAWLGCKTARDNSKSLTGVSILK